MRWKTRASSVITNIAHFKDFEHIILSSSSPSNVYEPIKYHARPYFRGGQDSCFGWPPVSTYNQYHFHNEADLLNIRFVEQLSPDIAYETIIYETGQVPTRKNNWHDFFNMLCWKSFPKSKSLLNRIQYRDGVLNQWKQRSATQNFCTHLDESGVLVFSRDANLTQLLRDMKWKELFWKRRQDCINNMRFIVFGHAIYEKFLHPYVGLTGKAMIFDHNCPNIVFSNNNEPGASFDPKCLELVDHMVHARLTDEEDREVGDPQHLFPLPLLGVPGWWKDQDEALYDNTQYFRTTRRKITTHSHQCQTNTHS